MSLCECRDGGHDSGDGIHCFCTGTLPLVITLKKYLGDGYTEVPDKGDKDEASIGTH